VEEVGPPLMAHQQVPQNRRLWDMLVSQARHRFRVYPSPAASHWVHKEYVQRGGRFVSSVKEDTRHAGRGRKPEKKDKD
jgi:hypothetical protein